MNVPLNKEWKKRKKKVVQLFARIIHSFLGNAFPEFNIYFQQSLGFSTIKKSLNKVSSYQKDAKDLIRVAANIT